MPQNRRKTGAAKSRVKYWRDVALANAAERDHFKGELARERKDITDFIGDLQLVRLNGAHLLCGSFWIRGEGLELAMRRYTDKIR